MKNLLRVIVVLIIFILGIILIDKVFVEDNEQVEDKTLEEKIEIKEFKFSFLIDSFVQEYEIVEFTEEEQQEIGKLLSKINYNREDIDLAFLGNYKIEFEGYELYFDDNDDVYGLLIKGDEEKIIYIKELKETLIKYLDQKNILKVYLYYRDDISYTEFKRIDISEEDSVKLYDIVDGIKLLEPHEYVNLMIAGKYYLIVGDTTIAFDEFPGYVLKNDDMAHMSDEFIAVMKKYIVKESDECCSCCPDGKPDDVCISMCCPCN